ncbi:sulfite exporter TauE/SafE family protein [Agrobacterium radiobacter]
MTAAILCGALVGFMLALVGGGGSILATPLLLYGVGISQPHLAIGTGALAVSFNAFTNFAAYARRGHVWWQHGASFAAFGVVGAVAGSALGKYRAAARQIQDSPRANSRGNRLRRRHLSDLEGDVERISTPLRVSADASLAEAAGSSVHDCQLKTG